MVHTRIALALLTAPGIAFGGYRRPGRRSSPSPTYARVDTETKAAAFCEGEPADRANQRLNGQGAPQIPADLSQLDFAKTALDRAPRIPAELIRRSTKPKVTGSNPVWRIGGRRSGFVRLRPGVEEQECKLASGSQQSSFLPST
jgi:hypothetical protein